MNFEDIRDDATLDEFMTTPSPALVRAVRDLPGDVLGLGASGKMGVELLALLRNADRQAGVRRRYFAASTFSRPEVRAGMEADGVRTFRGDLTDPRFLARLPPAPNVFYLAGFKFGTSGNFEKAYHLNVILPYLAGERFRRSRIVCFATANYYPEVSLRSGGATEATPVAPVGIYGWTAYGREQAFRVVSARHGTRVAFFRLGYAQHLRYGVLVDLAKQVKTRRVLDLPVNAVCLVSQRDANEAAIRCLGRAAAPPWTVNCCGPRVRLDRAAGIMAGLMGRSVTIRASDRRTAHVQSDRLAVSLFGPYRDRPDDMIRAAARWVLRGGTDWNKPTGFLSPHVY